MFSILWLEVRIRKVYIFVVFASFLLEQKSKTTLGIIIIPAAHFRLFLEVNLVSLAEKYWVAGGGCRGFFVSESIYAAGLSGVDCWTSSSRSRLMATVSTG